MAFFAFDSERGYLWPDGVWRTSPVPKRIRAVIDDPSSPPHGQAIWLSFDDPAIDPAVRNDAMQRIT